MIKKKRKEKKRSNLFRLKGKNDLYIKLTLSVSTSSIISSIVASSPIPYSVIACLSSSLVIKLVRNNKKQMKNIYSRIYKYWKVILEINTYPLPSLSKYWKALYKFSSFSRLWRCMVAVMNSM